MLFLQWKRKSVDDTKEEFTVNTSSVDRVGVGLRRIRSDQVRADTIPSKNFQQLSNTIVSLGFIDKLKKDIVDGPSYECSKVEKFSIDAMQRGFEEVPLPWILAIKQFKELVKNW